MIHRPAPAQFCNTSAELLVAFANHLTIGSDGWAQIAPFGDFPGVALKPDGKGGWKKVKAIQRMDAEAVTTMVNEYSAGTRGVSGFLKRRPIFLGHPDAPGSTGAQYADKSPKGVFANVALREDGFFGEPILTEEGEGLIATKKVRALSGRWEAEFVCEENGVPVYRPSKFLSAGLTNQPNLPVQLLNEAELPGDQSNTEKNTMKKETLIALLTGLGVQFSNDADETALAQLLTEKGVPALTALKAHETKVAELVNEKETITATITAKDGEIATLKTERDTLKTSFNNERTARIKAATTSALTSGRITAAELPDWERRLGTEAQFANELAALEKLTPKVKTESVTITRGTSKVEVTNARERGAAVTQICNEIATELKLNPVTQYSRIVKIAEQRHPQLFEAMAGPKVKTNGRQ